MLDLKNCTVPYFGFKAKLSLTNFFFFSYCTVPYFGFKAKLNLLFNKTKKIVLCLILDSRQNYRTI